MLSEKTQIKAYSNGTLDGLRRQMQTSGVALSVILPVITRAKQFDSILKFAVETNEHYDDLLSFGAVFPGDEDYKAKLRLMKEYGIKGFSVSGPFPATTGRICRELDRGSILYMEVHRHPVYGNHHMLCYGYSVRDGRLMLRMADGWISRIHDLPAGEELFAFCTVIRQK
jgi:hypothetical protein